MEIHLLHVLIHAIYRYPHVATEVLCSEIWSVVETCVREADQLLVPFWDNTLSMSNAELQQKPLIGPHFTKITTVFMAKKPDEARTLSSETKPMFIDFAGLRLFVLLSRCLHSFVRNQTFLIEYWHTSRSQPLSTWSFV
jgi:hypothetical protein